MKKYALLAGLYLIFCICSCKKDDLSTEIESEEIKQLKKSDKGDDPREHNITDWSKTKLQ